MPFEIGVAVNTCRNEKKILTVKSFYIELHTQYIHQRTIALQENSGRSVNQNYMY